MPVRRVVQECLSVEPVGIGEELGSVVALDTEPEELVARRIVSKTIVVVHSSTLVGNDFGATSCSCCVLFHGCVVLCVLYFCILCLAEHWSGCYTVVFVVLDQNCCRGQ